MDLNIKKIVNAWVTSFNPSEDEKQLAEKRLTVCNTCEFKGKNILLVDTCTKCGCPLSKKIFTSLDYTTCPLGKWDDLDREFKISKKDKYKII